MTTDSIESRLKEDRKFPPSDEFVKHARVTSHACSQAENSWQKISSSTQKSSTSLPATAASASSRSIMPSSVRSSWTRLAPR